MARPQPEVPRGQSQTPDQERPGASRSHRDEWRPQRLGIVTWRLAQPYRYWYGCAMAAGSNYRDRVREIALGEYGFVTTRQAASAGVPAVELRKLAARGALIHVAYGIYRVPDAPGTAFDQFAEALLRVGEGAYLRGDSVLALFGLADVNPRKVRVIAPKRTRARFPAFMEVAAPPPGEAPGLTRYEGLLANARKIVDALAPKRVPAQPKPQTWPAAKPAAKPRA